MFQLIAILVLAVGAIAGIGGFIHHERSVGADGKAAEVQPVIALCGDLAPKECAVMFTTWKADRDKAVDLNLKLKAEFDELNGQLVQQNAEGQRYVDDTDRRKRESLQLLEAAISKGRESASQEAALRTEAKAIAVKAAATSEKGQTCEQTLSACKQGLVDLGSSFNDMATRELRERASPANARSSAKGSPASP